MTIAELALKVAGAVGYTGGIRLDASKPDGTPRKLRIHRDWRDWDGRPGRDWTTGFSRRIDIGKRPLLAGMAESRA